VFSTAIRRSSAESLGLQKIEMTKFAQMSERPRLRFLAATRYYSQSVHCNAPYEARDTPYVAGGEHNKKFTETPHRLNTAQRLLNDLLTRRMQSGRVPTAPRPPASPPCSPDVTFFVTVLVHQAGGPVWSVRRQHPCCQSRPGRACCLPTRNSCSPCGFAATDHGASHLFMFP
jgi:hypothetical protein